MILMDPIQLDVFYDHTIAPCAHQGHFVSPKHILKEAHIQLLLIPSLEM